MQDQAAHRPVSQWQKPSVCLHLDICNSRRHLVEHQTCCYCREKVETLSIRDYDQKELKGNLGRLVMVREMADAGST